MSIVSLAIIVTYVLATVAGVVMWKTCDDRKRATYTNNPDMEYRIKILVDQLRDSNDQFDQDQEEMIRLQADIATRSRLEKSLREDLKSFDEYNTELRETAIQATNELKECQERLRIYSMALQAIALKIDEAAIETDIYISIAK